MKKKRIFIGYALSENLQQTILEWQQKHISFPVRWTLQEKLHVTLVPPWYEKNTEDIIDYLQSTRVFISPFQIKFDTIELGINKNNPRLIWARGETPKELALLKRQLADMLQKKQETRLPLLHITVARFTKEQFSLFSNKHFFEEINWSDQVSSFTVFESHLSKTGAVYKKLAEIQLK